MTTLTIMTTVCNRIIGLGMAMTAVKIISKEYSRFTALEALGALGKYTLPVSKDKEEEVKCMLYALVEHTKKLTFKLSGLASFCTIGALVSIPTVILNAIEVGLDLRWGTLYYLCFSGLLFYVFNIARKDFKKDLATVKAISPLMVKYESLLENVKNGTISLNDALRNRL